MEKTSWFTFFLFLNFRLTGLFRIYFYKGSEGYEKVQKSKIKNPIATCRYYCSTGIHSRWSKTVKSIWEFSSGVFSFINILSINRRFIASRCWPIIFVCMFHVLLFWHDLRCWKTDELSVVVCSRMRVWSGRIVLSIYILKHFIHWIWYITFCLLQILGSLTGQLFNRHSRIGCVGLRWFRSV